MPVTIKDVAKAVGVSTSTVSRVLTGHPGIGAATRQRVLETVALMKYHPNATARSLVNHRTYALCAVLPTGGQLSDHDTHSMKALLGLSAHARDRGYSVVLLHPSDSDDEWRGVLHTVTTRSVDGLVLFIDREKDRVIEFLHKSEFPFLLLGHPEEHEHELWVDNDHQQAMYQSTLRLLDLGHRRIAYLGGPRFRRFTKDRFDGYFQACYERGIAVDESIVQTDAEFTLDAGANFIARRITRGEHPRAPFTALLTNDDLQAVGAARALRDSHVDGVSIVGYNSHPITSWYDPPISTVDQNPEKLGRYAARLLIDQLEGERENVRHYKVRSTPVDRASVGPPPREKHPAQAPAHPSAAAGEGAR